MKIKTLYIFCVFILCLVLPVSIFAARTELQKDVPIMGDFPIGPTSFDLLVISGESFTKTLEITNRSGKLQFYKVEVEDFEGSADDPTQATNLKGSVAGKYGAKDWITPEVKKFSLNHGERFFLDVKVLVPTNADPGDHYGAVLVSSLEPSQAKSESGTNIMITSRVGSLFLLRVDGPIVEKGSLESFRVKKSFYEKGPVDFQFIYRNEGTVRLLPAGEIKVTNMFGRSVGNIKIESYKVLRDSERLNQSILNKKYLFGKYTAIITLDRGYANVSDTKTITFWAFPIKEVAIAMAILTVIFIAVILIVKRKRKNKRTM